MAKILLVEDDKSLREIYGVRLLAEGYDIVSAGDGEEALAMAIKERPNLIVSDVMMPKISGFDMLDILRSTTETKDTKVIMMTALSSEDHRLRGEQLGADRYLVKSQVGIEDVVRTVHDVLGDAPIAAVSQNAFATPGPTALSRPTTPTVPPRPVSSTPAEPITAPQQPFSQPQVAISQPAVAPQQPAPSVPSNPVSAPFPQPQAPASYSTPQPTVPASAAISSVSSGSTTATDPSILHASGLPQPTAPFSTDRPAGLADRIIQPLDKAPEEGEPIADLMRRELGTPVQTEEQPAAQSPQAPMPSPTIPLPPAPQPPAQPQQPTIAPVQESPHGINFEETPRTNS